ncbi:MAG: hypothetical protein M3O22_00925 [Pseudomonadota bacterium]|nr:hypothetical protein [Pseudomonadota bacterium]
MSVPSRDPSVQSLHRGARGSVRTQLPLALAGVCIVIGAVWYQKNQKQTPDIAPADTAVRKSPDQPEPDISGLLPVRTMDTAYGRVEVNPGDSGTVPQTTGSVQPDAGFLAETPAPVQDSFRIPERETAEIVYGGKPVSSPVLCESTDVFSDRTDGPSVCRAAFPVPGAWLHMSLMHFPGQPEADVVCSSRVPSGRDPDSVTPKCGAFTGGSYFSGEWSGDEKDPESRFRRVFYPVSVPTAQ